MLMASLRAPLDHGFGRPLYRGAAHQGKFELLNLEDRLMSFRSTLRLTAATLIGVCLTSCMFAPEPESIVRGMWQGTTSTGLGLAMTLAQEGKWITGTGTRTQAGSSSSSEVAIGGVYDDDQVLLDFKRAGAEDLRFRSRTVTATKMEGKFGSGLTITFNRP
jgi:hypothetical protein